MKRIYCTITLFLVLVALFTACGATDYGVESAAKPVWLIEPKYDYADKFSTGIAMVGDDTGYYFIDKEQSNVFGNTYFSIARIYAEDILFVNDLPEVTVSEGETSVKLGRDGIPIQPAIPAISNVDEVWRSPLRIAVSDSGNYGMVNMLDEWVVPPIYDRIRLEYDHHRKQRTPVVSLDGQCGFLTPEGEAVFIPSAEYIYEFQNGYALIYIMQQKFRLDENGYDRFAGYNFADEHGKLVFAKSFTEYKPELSEGVVCYKENELYGYMNLDGEVLIEPQFQWAGPFSEGKAAVCRDGKVWYIDNSGAVVIRARRGDYGGKFENGMASIGTKGDRYGVIDANGKWIVKPRYERAYYHEDANIWELQRGSNRDVVDLYFVDSGITIKRVYLFETLTENSVICSKNSGLFQDDFFIVDVRSGKTIWRKFNELGYSYASEFIGAKKDGFSGYVDNYGMWVIAPQFDDAKPFSEGVAAVCVDDKWGFIALPT